MGFWKRSFFFMFFSFALLGVSGPSIIFYNHSNLPFDHCEKVLRQAKGFNPTIPIYLIDSLRIQSKNIPKLRKLGVSFIPTESIRKSALHEKFNHLMQRRFLSDKKAEQNKLRLWFMTHDLINHYQMDSVFLIELDTLIYLDIKEHLGAFQNFYSGIATAFENDHAFNPSFFYIHHPKALEKFNQLLYRELLNFNRIENLCSMIKKEGGKALLDSLPVLPDLYIQENPVISMNGQLPQDKRFFSNHFPIFESLFDNCAIGEYLAEYNPEKQLKEVGYINPRSVINPYHFRFEWHLDSKKRNIPYLVYKNKKHKLNTLKIESKQLDPFLSF